MDIIKSAFACYKFVTKQYSNQYIFSSCIESGIFLTKWKMANVVPIHKRDDKQNIKDYRPVSLFPISEKYLNVLHRMKCPHLL